MFIHNGIIIANIHPKFFTTGYDNKGYNNTAFAEKSIISRVGIQLILADKIINKARENFFFLDKTLRSKFDCFLLIRKKNKGEQNLREIINIINNDIIFKTLFSVQRDKMKINKNITKSIFLNFCLLSGEINNL